MPRVRQSTVLILCLFVLFFSVFQNYQDAQKASVDAISKTNCVNVQNVQPKELFIETWSLVKGVYWDDDLNEQSWGRWKKRYYNVIETDEDAYVAINTMIASLNDPYSKFLSAKEFMDQNATIDSKIYGIGVNIASVAGKIYIANVIKGAPADVAGVKQGDMLTKVDGNDVRGKSLFQVALYIKGNLGAHVELELQRGGEKLVKKIKREEIKVKTVEHYALNENVGYIRILSFISRDTPAEFITALNALRHSKALVLDLRGNTGGLFQNAVFVSNLFLPKGKIVSVIGRNGNSVTYRASLEEYIFQKPLIVLVDSESASASEIVAGALSDNGRSELVGVSTFGKGLVQKVFALPNQTGMNLTIARYLTPKGYDINKKGIKPHYVVEVSDEDIVQGYDRQLTFAFALIEKELKKDNRELAKAAP